MGSVGTPALPASLDSQILSKVLTPGFEAWLDCEVEIVAIEPRPFDGSSSFSVWRFDALLACGITVPVFAKDLDPAHQLDEAKLVRTADLDRSRREVHVYREILPRLDLGTPFVFGVHWDEPAGPYWLFLEDAGPKRLSRLGDFDLWVEAARWLGRFHSAVTQPEKSWGLQPVTLESLRFRAERVSALLDRLDPDTAPEAEPALASLDQLLDRVASTPHGMLHGEYFGKNVVVRPHPASEPIAVIDWETAGVGPQYLDLVSISAGRWTFDQRLNMRRAYFEAARAGGARLLEWEDFNADVDAAAAVNALAWLGWWSDGDDAHIKRWAREVRFAGGCLNGSRGEVS